MEPEKRKITKEAERQNAKQAKGICRKCQRTAQVGRTLCVEHLISSAREGKRKRDARVSAGVCKTGCGKLLAPDSDKCADCLAKQSAYFKQWYDKNRRKKR